jgi:hypothetical protein
LMLRYQHSKSFLIALLSTLNELLFRVWHEVSKRLDRGNEEKFQRRK